MKRKNRTFQNRCTVRGQVVDQEPLDQYCSLQYLLVETAANDGTSMCVPCLIRENSFRHPVKEGDWVTVSGTLDVCKEHGIHWITALIAETTDDPADQLPFTIAAFEGEMLDGGCMIDHGTPVTADFRLAAGSSSKEDRLIVDCLAEGPALQDYLDCLAAGHVKVMGNLDFAEPDESSGEVVRFYLDVLKIKPLDAGKEPQCREGAHRDDG